MNKTNTNISAKNAFTTSFDLSTLTSTEPIVFDGDITINQDLAVNNNTTVNNLTTGSSATIQSLNTQMPFLIVETTNNITALNNVATYISSADVNVSFSKGGFITNQGVSPPSNFKIKLPTTATGGGNYRISFRWLFSKTAIQAVDFYMVLVVNGVGVVDMASYRGISTRYLVDTVGTSRTAEYFNETNMAGLTAGDEIELALIINTSATDMTLEAGSQIIFEKLYV